MTEVLHTNVFFFITGIAVIIISVIFIILLFHVIRALKSIRRILGSIERGTEVISEDMQNMRDHFADGGLVVGILSLLRGFSRGKETSRKRPVKKRRNRAELKITDVTR